MSKLTFQEEQYKQTKATRTPGQADSFGLSTFLIQKGFAKDLRSAKQISNLIMIITVVVSLILIFVINTTGGASSIDEKYYYDPNAVDE
jgi:hypothetical protein